MKVTVCEMKRGAEAVEKGWEALTAHVAVEKSDVVLLPEMPFYPWLPASQVVDPQAWVSSMEQHAQWENRFPELGGSLVLSTRPAIENNRRLNEGFVWEPGKGSRPAHHKYYLPNEPHYWEATWYQPGSGKFAAVHTDRGVFGFMICSDIWFSRHAKTFGQNGVEMIVNPRCTRKTSNEKWQVACQAAAILAGAFCLTSNSAGQDPSGFDFGGRGMIINPDGRLLAATSDEQPFVTIDIDLEEARKAKATYPRYILD